MSCFIFLDSLKLRRVPDRRSIRALLQGQRNILRHPGGVYPMRDRAGDGLPNRGSVQGHGPERVEIKDFFLRLAQLSITCLNVTLRTVQTYCAEGREIQDLFLLFCAFSNKFSNRFSNSLSRCSRWLKVLKQLKQLLNK